MRRLPNVVLCLALLAALGPWPASADPHKLQPRIPQEKGRYARLPEEMVLEQVVIKFQEGTAVRLRGGHLMAQDRSERDRRDLEARGLTPAAVDGDVAEVRRLVALAPAAQNLRRLFSVAEDVLAERRAAGEERSRRELADLDLYFEVRLKPKATAGDVSELLDDLNALESVEIAYAQPPAVPGSLGEPERVTAAVVTPSFQGLQGYLNAAPQGVNALYAWTQSGGTGSGVKIVDVEGGWQTTHEDLPTLFHAAGTNSTDYNNWRNHGTAVLGEVVAKTNGLGVTGIAYQAQAGYESVLSYGPDAILNGAAAAGAGGIVLIPLHTGGPANSSPCTCNTSQCDLIPMEYYSSYYDAIANATANGVTVVEAAGNGSTNLDDPVYGDAFNRSVRDSGAILLAASTSVDRSPTCWTNWGSRVDVHGWGENVVTLGYGDLQGGSADSWYTAFFSGTSSASPIVAGAAASVQGRSLATVSSSLSPLVLRDLLRSTGTPQVPGAKNIGPLPNLRAAFDTLAANQPPVAAFTVTCSVLFCSFDASASTDDHGVASYGWSFGDTFGATNPYPFASHGYAGAGSYTVTLTVKDTFGVASSTSRQVNLANEDPTLALPQSYVALPPCRLFDTRSTDPVIATGGILTSDQTRQLQMTGRCGIPSDARAVAVNVVALTATNRGNFQFYPGNLAGGVTATSSLNFGTANRANNAIVRLATNGAGTLTLKPFVSGAGQVHMVMDVSGYFTESRAAAPGSAGPLGFQPLTPCRIADSRSGSPLNGNTIYPYTVQGGSCGVPAGAEAASLLLTLAQPSANGSALLFPNDIALPASSTINLVAGTPLITNSAVTRLAATSPNDLAFRYSTSGATAHVILDTNGYFKAGAPLRYRPLTPCRLVDTRSAGQGAPVLSHGVARTFQAQGNCGVPAGAKAVFLNVNAFSPTVAGSITAYAGGSPQPSISTVNFEVADLSAANGVLVPLGTTVGQDLALAASVPSGTVHAIVDVYGYFENDPAPGLADFVFLCTDLACAFDASGSYDNFEIVNYHWSFGDSSSADTASVTQNHTFAAQGSYPVTLTVSDAFGQTASKTWTVTVSAEAVQPAQSYFALPPCRLLDTRSGAGGILTSGEVRPLQITGGCGVPASAKAVAVNLTAISATGRGNFQFYPGDQTGGLTATSNLNFGTSNRANNAILRLGAGGTVKVNPFVAGSGQVHLLMDVQGYFSDATEPGATPLGYGTLSCRLVTGGVVAGGTPSTVTVQGQCGVPVGTAAAFLNTSITNPTANGNVTLYANGSAPATSTMNFLAGTPGLTNGAITSLAASTPDLAVRYSATAPNQLDMVLDVFGYFKNDPLLMKYHPIQPCRAIDTRSNSQGAPALVSNQRRDFRLQGNCGIPDGARAVFAHVLAFEPPSGGYLFAYPYFGHASLRTLVLDGNEPTLGNGAIVPLESLDDASYDFSLEAWLDGFSGSVNAIVDVFGYFE